jgi:hypothetical protein
LGVGTVVGIVKLSSANKFTIKKINKYLKYDIIVPLLSCKIGIDYNRYLLLMSNKKFKCGTKIEMPKFYFNKLKKASDKFKIKK